jgi:hypothetical protein
VGRGAPPNLRIEDLQNYTSGQIGPTRIIPNLK